MYFVRNDQTYFTKILVKTLLFSIKKIKKKKKKPSKIFLCFYTELFIFRDKNSQRMATTTQLYLTNDISCHLKKIYIYLIDTKTGKF